MAFSNALLGIVHSMAHKTGAAYSGGHIVHGCANAMYLPKVIAHIQAMNTKLDIPACIHDYEGGIIDDITSELKGRK